MTPRKRYSFWIDDEQAAGPDAAQAIIQAVSTSAITFSDDFNDGNADGWWLGPSIHTPWVNGNWRVENGTLVQDAPGDAFVALVQNIEVSSQSLTTDVFPYQVAGYAGVTFGIKILRTGSRWCCIRVQEFASMK